MSQKRPFPGFAVTRLGREAGPPPPRHRVPLPGPGSCGAHDWSVSWERLAYSFGTRSVALIMALPLTP